MTDTLDSPYGFAIRRNNSCLSSELDCGTTWAPFHACCPSGTFCPTSYNSECCPSNADCGQLLLNNPQCGNTTANLYNWQGYFCCPPDTTGFGLQNGWVGCTNDLTSLGANATLLAIITVGSGMRSPVLRLLPAHEAC